MKSFILGFIAAILGCFIFLAGLILWVRLTAPSGVSSTSVAVSTTEATDSQATDTASDEAASNGNTSSSDTASSSDETSSKTDETKETPAAYDLDKAVTAEEAPKKYSEYMKVIEAELKPEYGYNLKIAYMDDRIIIAVWESNLVQRLNEGLENGTKDTIWDSQKTSLRALCQKYYDSLKDHSIDNGHISLYLLDERNLDNIILGFDDGKLVHDGLDHE